MTLNCVSLCILLVVQVTRVQSTVESVCIDGTPAINFEEVQNALMRIYSTDIAVLNFLEDFESRCITECVNGSEAIGCNEASIAIQSTLIYLQMEENEGGVDVTSVSIGIGGVCLVIVITFVSISLLAHWYYHCHKKKIRSMSIWSRNPLFSYFRAL